MTILFREQGFRNYTVNNYSSDNNLIQYFSASGKGCVLLPSEEWSGG